MTRALRLAACLLLGSVVGCANPAPPAPTPGAIPPVDLVIANGMIVTMDPQRRVLKGASLVVEGDRIARVLRAGAPLPPARETIDARGHLVIPGLVNVHGHVPMVLFRGLADDMALMEWLNDFIFPAEAKNVDAEFVYWGTLLACVEMARSGTTTFSDMYYFEDAVARATEKAGLRGVLGQTIIGFPAPDYKTVAAALAGTEAFLKRWKGHPRIVPSVAPHALYTTTPATVRAAAALARKYGVPFQIHANESPAEDAEVTKRHGATSVRILEREGALGPNVLIHHGTTLTPADVALLAKRGVAVSHNPESNMKGASGLAPLDRFLAANLTVGLGTDGPAGNNNLDMFEELDTCAKVHKMRLKDPTAMPARVVFELATLGGAKALGLSDQIGSLEVGKRADVVLIDLSPPELTPLYDVYSQLVYAIKGGHVRTVVIDGRVVVRDRRMTTVPDIAGLIAKARELQAKILASLPPRKKKRR